ncbi:MAG: GNAT family N-acetyltransferase [Bacteriovoracaceae bacterium]|jgi:ribosomal protein S18 acetylase RimI-like enzyme|nr:GNAT family N-acetyltransferase [Bacteriovoracaceae bacterium]
MSDIEYIPLDLSRAEKIVSFCDRTIGDNYYSTDDIGDIYRRSILGGRNCSFLAICDLEIVGIRFSYAPNCWLDLPLAVTPDKWNVEKPKVAYFKSLFIDPSFQCRGIGKSLSSMSIEMMKEMGARAIVCHSWLESPGSSSLKYLKSMGFSKVASHPKFWHHIDYQCVRCKPEKCVCTAIEMILSL